MLIVVCILNPPSSHSTLSRSSFDTMAIVLPRLADILIPVTTDLRAQLAAAINPSHHAGPSNPVQHEYNVARASSSSSPREHNIDPSMNPGGQGQMMSASALAAGDSGGDDAGGKGGKRELSQSKRAAQNRAAQVCLHFFVVATLQRQQNRCFVYFGHAQVVVLRWKGKSSAGQIFLR